MAGRPDGRRVGRRVAAIAGIAVAAIAVLLVALVLLVDSGAVTKRVVALVLPRASAALGREVSLTNASLSLFPNPKVGLEGLTVAGRPGEPPLVGAESLDVEIGLWPLLTSLGKEIDVRALTLVRPSVNLVQAADGTWNYEGLGGAKDANAPPPAEEGGAKAQVAIRRVRVEKAALRLVDRRGGKDDAGVALTDLDLDATGLGAGLPFDARLAAALADDHQNVHAELSVAALPAALPERPADWPAVQGSFRVGGLALDRLRPLLPASLGTVVTGGAVSLDARVSTDERRGYRLDGTGDLREVRLRGQPASGHFRAAAALSPANPAAAKFDVTELALRGPGVDLGGNLSVQASPLRAWFVITGPLLDLDAVMGLLPESGAKPPPAPKAGPLLPEGLRRQVAAAGAKGTVAIGELRAGRIVAHDLRASARLSGGALVLDALEAGVFGGRVSGAGTRVALAEAEPSWRLAARLDGLDLAEAGKAFSGLAPLQGRLGGRLDVAGKGTAWEKLREGLGGLASLAVKDGALVTTDLGDQVLGAVSRALQATGRGGAAAKVGGTAGGRTTFRDLAGDFEVKDGFLAAKAPVRVDAPFGKVSLGGRLGLDGRLDLTGTAAVPASALAGLAGGLPLPRTLDVPLGLGGTLERPAVQVRADEAVGGLATGAARQATKEVRGKAERAGRRALGDALKGLGGRR